MGYWSGDSRIYTMGHQKTAGRGRWKKLITASLCLLGLGNVVMSQGKIEWDPVKTACNIRAARAMVVGNKMYLDGGEIIHQGQYKDTLDKPCRISDTVGWENQHRWELDLSQKFDVSRPPWTAYAKPEDWNKHYDGLYGTLWNIGDGRFYTVGGRYPGYQGPPPGQRIHAPYYTQNASGYYFQLPDPQIFAYDTQTGNWTSQPLPKDLHRLFDNAYTQSARNKVGYTLGGNLVKERDFSTSDPGFWAGVGDWVDTISAFDFKTGNFNFTTMPFGIGQTTQVIMHSLDRVGHEGILVAFGGISNNNNIHLARPMNEILIYDVETSKWMKQKVTGEIPSPRSYTCSVLVPAPDLSSFQIYLFSGTTQEGIYILDMHVLSIPAFTWTKIDDMKGYPNEWPIADMSCGLYEERQFIIVPGQANVTTAATTDNNFWIECNNFTSVHVFDTYDWVFKPEFDPDTKGSRVSPTIVNLVGGNDTGGATLKQPEAGWDDKALDTIFSIRNELPHQEKLQFPLPNPITTSQPQSTPWDKTKQTTMSKKNAIIGGAVGGVCVLALTAGILIFYIKRYRKPRQQKPEKPELDGEDDRVELDGVKHIPELHGTSNSSRSYELHA